MNVIFTCGGTGGHINPAIAVANILKERHPDCKILFIGAKNNMEEKLVPRAGYELVTLPGGGLGRSMSLKNLRWNMKVVRRIMRAVKACKKIIREFDADVIVGTGGFASFPALYAGAALGVPTCVHESNAVPGLTTKLVADRATKVLVSFAESAQYYRHPEKVEVVGMPVRKEFVTTEKEAARKELGLDERPLVVSAFGSLGAEAMNHAIVDMLKLEQEAGFPFQHIHATGTFGWEWMPGKLDEMGLTRENCPGVDVREYIYNMPTVMAAADVIISRAGASSCNEIAASGTPCVLIPSPNVTDNHQEKNARVISDKGGAVLLLESECTAQRLYEEIQNILENPRRQADMADAMKNACVPDSAQRICDIMEELAKTRK